MRALRDAGYAIARAIGDLAAEHDHAPGLAGLAVASSALGHAQLTAERIKPGERALIAATLRAAAAHYERAQHVRAH